MVGLDYISSVSSSISLLLLSQMSLHKNWKFARQSNLSSCSRQATQAGWKCYLPLYEEHDLIGRNAATRVHSNPGSSADQFDWEGRKINGNRKNTPRKCPFQGRNLKVTTPEEGRGKEKVETCSVAVPSEVGFFWVQWRSSPHNLDQYRGKIEFSTLLADLRRHLNTIPHLRSLLQVSYDPNPRKKRQLNNIGGSQAPQKCSSWPKT